MQKRVSRRGNPWIQFDLQDTSGSAGVLIFNKLVDKYNSSIDGEYILRFQVPMLEVLKILFEQETLK